IEVSARGSSPRRRTLQRATRVLFLLHVVALPEAAEEGAAAMRPAWFALPFALLIMAAACGKSSALWHTMPGIDGCVGVLAADCADGAGTASCACEGAVRTGGFCCGHLWQAVSCAATPRTDLVAPDRVTAWNPGILNDAQLGLPLGPDGLPHRTAICATLSPGANI